MVKAECIRRSIDVHRDVLAHAKRAAERESKARLHRVTTTQMLREWLMAGYANDRLIARAAKVSR